MDPMSDKALPEVNFTVTFSGITLYSPRLTTPRFIAFDKKGRCGTCSSAEFDIDYAVMPDAVLVKCTPIGGEASALRHCGADP